MIPVRCTRLCNIGSAYFTHTHSHTALEEVVKAYFQVQHYRALKSLKQTQLRPTKKIDGKNLLLGTGKKIRTSLKEHKFTVFLATKRQ